ncbi:hypothetical protein FB45DRAFT_992290 [Roridomyces roridus]|uniref:Fruit-body specific protein a n=1 Tax=Roridomyces roridus TaxID=1738132 RepID=A0AAD7FIT4_9AGAR|nr:hypothetical protein FB45DRAFT_992290 [Roridomyces roridus]
MRFTTVFTALAAFAVGSVSNAQFSGESITNALTLTAQNHYGSPNPPWVFGAKPGWYYGKGTPPVGIACFLDELFCELLELFPFCFHCPKPPPPPPPHKPPPPPEYSPSFYNETCATQDSSFMTFGLVDTVADCEAMCDTVSGCTFVNTYFDINGKNGSTLLTCSLFSKCLTDASNDNCGGQDQGNGGLTEIQNSSGFCKAKPTA